jgi:hypothetical protein
MDHRGVLSTTSGVLMNLLIHLLDLVLVAPLPRVTLIIAIVIVIAKVILIAIVILIAKVIIAMVIIAKIMMLRMRTAVIAKVGSLPSTIPRTQRTGTRRKQTIGEEVAGVAATGKVGESRIIMMDGAAGVGPVGGRIEGGIEGGNEGGNEIGIVEKRIGVAKRIGVEKIGTAMWIIVVEKKAAMWIIAAEKKEVARGVGKELGKEFILKGVVRRKGVGKGVGKRKEVGKQVPKGKGVDTKARAPLPDLDTLSAPPTVNEYKALQKVVQKVLQKVQKVLLCPPVAVHQHLLQHLPRHHHHHCFQEQFHQQFYL